MRTSLSTPPLGPKGNSRSLVAVVLFAIVVVCTWLAAAEAYFWVALTGLWISTIMAYNKANPQRRFRAGCLGAALLVAGVLLIYPFHAHFSRHADAAYAQEQQDRLNAESRRFDVQRRIENERQYQAHERRLAWQRSHPQEYATQRREAALELQREQQAQAAAQNAERESAARAANAQRESDANAAQQQEAIPSNEVSDMMQGLADTVDSVAIGFQDYWLDITISQSMWDDANVEQRELYSRRACILWRETYERNHPDNHRSIMEIWIYNRAHDELKSESC